jgi:hypothetical protein
MGQTQTTDLLPLQGMTSIRILSWRGTPVKDLSPLRGMASLQELTCPFSKVFDRDVIHQNLDVLRSLPSLRSINQEPAAEFLKPVDPAPGP